MLKNLDSKNLKCKHLYLFDPKQKFRLLPNTFKTNEAKNSEICQKKNFHWNDDLNLILINLLKIYSNAPFEYIVQLLNLSGNTIVIRSEVHNHKFNKCRNFFWC
jgi:hypothetical protein